MGCCGSSVQCRLNDGALGITSCENCRYWSTVTSSFSILDGEAGSHRGPISAILTGCDAKGPVVQPALDGRSAAAHGERVLGGSEELLQITGRGSPVA